MSIYNNIENKMVNIIFIYIIRFINIYYFIKILTIILNSYKLIIISYILI